MSGSERPPSPSVLARAARHAGEFAAVHVLNPAYRAQRLARPATRATVRAYAAGWRFRQTAIRWSQEQRRDWVLARLRAVVRRAAKSTAFYMDRFREVGFDPHADFTFDDFARLPELGKSDLAAAGDSILAADVPRSQLRRDATGGSSGEPTIIWTGPEERGWRESGSEFFMERIGIRKGMRAGYLWGHHLDPVASDRAGDRLRASIENIRWFDCLRLSPAKLSAYHAALNAWRPRYMVAYASALAALAEQVAARTRATGVSAPVLHHGRRKAHACAA
jgi:phenylacetate-coenzyme A ligase PaaK-like adenylate-forming protein